MMSRPKPTWKTNRETRIHDALIRRLKRDYIDLSQLDSVRVENATLQTSLAELKQLLQLQSAAAFSQLHERSAEDESTASNTPATDTTRMPATQTPQKPADQPTVLDFTSADIINDPTKQQQILTNLTSTDIMLAIGHMRGDTQTRLNSVCATLLSDTFPDIDTKEINLLDLTIMAHIPAVQLYHNLRRTAIDKCIENHATLRDDTMDGRCNVTYLSPSKWYREIVTYVHDKHPSSSSATTGDPLYLPERKSLDNTAFISIPIQTDIGDQSRSIVLKSYSPDTHYLLGKTAGMVSSLRYQPSRDITRLLLPANAPEIQATDIDMGRSLLSDTQLYINFAMAFNTSDRTYVDFLRHESTYLVMDANFTVTLGKLVTAFQFLDNQRRIRDFTMVKSNKLILTTNENTTDVGVPPEFVEAIKPFIMNNQAQFVRETNRGATIHQRHLTEGRTYEDPIIVRDSIIGRYFNFDQENVTEITTAATKAGSMKSEAVNTLLVLSQPEIGKLKCVKRLYQQLLVCQSVIRSLVANKYNTDGGARVLKESIIRVFSRCAVVKDDSSVSYIPSLEMFPGSLYFTMLSSQSAVKPIIDRPVTSMVDAFATESRKLLIDVTFFYMNNTPISASKLQSAAPFMKGSYGQKTASFTPLPADASTSTKTMGMRLLSTPAHYRAYASLQHKLQAIACIFIRRVWSNNHTMHKDNPWFTYFTSTPTPEHYRDDNPTIVPRRDGTAFRLALFPLSYCIATLPTTNKRSNQSNDAAPHDQDSTLLEFIHRLKTGNDNPFV